MQFPVMRGVMFKKISYYAFLLSLVIGVAISSYWYGTTVGASQTYMNQKAGEAALLANKLKFDNVAVNAGLSETLKPSEKIKMEFEVNRALIDVGRVLEQRLPFNPLYSDTMDATNGLLNVVAEYRKDNPHIVDGIEYSPFKSGWREQMYTKDWEDSVFSASTPDQIEEFRKKHLSETTLQETYYLKALSYGDGVD